MIVRHKMITFRVILCLLSLVIVATAVDTIPDPPAVQPKISLNYLILGMTHHAAGSHVKRIPNRPIWMFEVHTSVFAFREVVDGPSSEANLIYRAADASPPNSSLS